MVRSPLRCCGRSWTSPRSCVARARTSRVRSKSSGRGGAELMAAVLASPPTPEEVQGSLRLESRSEAGAPASLRPCWDGREAPSGFAASFEIGRENVSEARHDRESLSACAGRRFDPLSFVYGSVSLAAGVGLCTVIMLLVQHAGVVRPRQPIDWLPPIPPQSRDA